jgi:purine-binding chemotaxis protein CheW
MKIDWDSARRGLQELRLSLDQGGAHKSPARLRAQLAQRARALAASAEDGSAQGALQVLEVTLAGVRYAFELEYLVAALPWTRLTPVPGAPPFVLGMLLEHGRVISCIDLLSFLGLPVQELVDPTGIIVLADGDMEIGLPVQQVGGMQSLAGCSAVAPGQWSDKVRQMLLGVTPGGAFLMDGARLLSSPDLPVSG